MNLLFRIVYAAHANGTHHKLALDALRHLQVHGRATCGSACSWPTPSSTWKAPRRPTTSSRISRTTCCTRATATGAARRRRCSSWYQHLVEALTLQDWPTAVYCAGVLSHYYTDPLHPFHTAQSEAENNIHRAAEWSISQAYDELARARRARFRQHRRGRCRTGPNWLVQLRRARAPRWPTATTRS